MTPPDTLRDATRAIYEAVYPPFKQTTCSHPKTQICARLVAWWPREWGIIMLKFGLILGAVVTGVLPQSGYCQSHQPIVAVNEIEDAPGTGHARDLASMITTAIVNTGKFRVVERAQLNQLEQEQMRAQRGQVTSRNGGRVGGFEGADYLVYGSITNFQAKIGQDAGATIGRNVAKSFLGAFGGGLSNSCSKGVYYLSVDVRITDGATSQVRYAKSVDASQNVDGVCGGATVPQANASELLRSVANQISTGLLTTVYPMKVMGVSADGTITINFGEGALQVGQTLAVFSKGEEMFDPDTHESRGFDEERIGLIRVTDVLSKMSKAEVVAGLTSPAPIGSIVRPATDADLAKFRASTSGSGKRHHGGDN